MATVYDGNKIGILPGGTTYGALSTTTLVATTPTALAAANTARIVHHATQRHGRLAIPVLLR